MTNEELTELVEKIFAENGRAMSDEELRKIAEKEAYRTSDSSPFLQNYVVPVMKWTLTIMGVALILAGIELGGAGLIIGVLTFIGGYYFFPWCTRIIEESIEEKKVIIYKRLKHEQSINNGNKDKR